MMCYRCEAHTLVLYNKVWFEYNKKRFPPSQNDNKNRDQAFFFFIEKRWRDKEEGKNP